ncbi:MAG: hypothetical protein RL701_4937, partial [Pseudomonadota bacterium]
MHDVWQSVRMTEEAPKAKRKRILLV